MRLGTGDLVLLAENKKKTPFSYGWFVFDKAIEYFTRSPYVHVGLVLVDPPFSVPRGTYLWESGYEACVNPETGKQNLGVRLTPMHAVLDKHDTVFVRACTLGVSDAKLKKIHADVFLKPYDMCLSDWLLATLRLDSAPQKTDRFWCSAFVAYVLVQLGWLPRETDWSIVRPCDLSSSSTYLAWEAPVYTSDTRYRGGAGVCAAPLVSKLEGIGVPCERKSDSEVHVRIPSGYIRVTCSAAAFETSIVEVTEPRDAARSPRAFASLKALVQYIVTILDAHRLA
jgi:hypothetical protein